MWVVDLIINAVPVWVWLVIAAVALALTAQFWMPIWLVLPRWLKATILGTGAILAAYGFGRNKGFRDEQVRRDRANARAVETRKEVDDEVRNDSDAAVDRKLDRWMRDD
jgi:hypothetical protein